MWRSGSLSSFVEFRSAVSEDKSIMYHPILGSASILFIPSARKTPTSERRLRSYFRWLPVKFRWILFSSFRGEVKNVSKQIRGQGGHLVFPTPPPPPRPYTWQRTLRSCFMSSLVEFRLAVLEEKSTISQPVRGQDGHLVLRSARKTQT